MLSPMPAFDRALTMTSLAVLALTLSLALAPQARAQSQPPTTTAAPHAAAAMTPAEQSAVLHALADQLRARFVFPEVGERYASLLEQRRDSQAYAKLKEPKAFAAAVTVDLQKVHPDRHLRLQLSEGENEGSRKMIKRGGPGRLPWPPLAEARMIGEVAYLKFNVFMGNDHVAQAARQFLLSNVQHIKAVVIDSRSNRGGNLEVMDAVLPLLYSKPTTLVRMDTRADAALPDPEPDDKGLRTLVRQESPATLVRHDHRVTPDPEVKDLQTVPVYYLTSPKTASAAEHLALALKSTGRGRLIGEPSAGAGHFGGEEAIGERFTAFIPVGRTYDPATNQGWEGQGVAPDVRVPASQALSKALELAREAGVKTE